MPTTRKHRVNTASRRRKLLLALSLFPTVCVSGKESNEELQKKLIKVTSETGLELFGLPYMSSPHAWRQACLDMILCGDHKWPTRKTVFNLIRTALIRHERMRKVREAREL